MNCVIQSFADSPISNLILKQHFEKESVLLLKNILNGDNRDLGKLKKLYFSKRKDLQENQQNDASIFIDFILKEIFEKKTDHYEEYKVEDAWNQNKNKQGGSLEMQGVLINVIDCGNENCKKKLVFLPQTC